MEKKEEKVDDKVQLIKTVGYWDAAALIIGFIIGSGIFISPQGVLRNAGSPGMAFIMWAVTGWDLGYYFYFYFAFQKSIYTFYSIQCHHHLGEFLLHRAGPDLPSHGRRVRLHQGGIWQHGETKYL